VFAFGLPIYSIILSLFGAFFFACALTIGLGGLLYDSNRQMLVDGLLLFGFIRGLLFRKMVYCERWV